MFHPFHHPTVARRSTSLRTVPRGFTLVELLVTIVILAILSSMVLMALANTQGSAREARTRTTIAKLDALIMAKWETYQTRRVPLNLSPADKTNQNRNAHALWKLNAIRDIMRMEMPDRHSDYQTGPQAPKLPTATMSLPLAYQRLAQNSKSHADYTRVESAECLYLIVAHGCNDPDALSQFNESEIDDTDGDGMNEFIDGWGRPISFLRWAPAYLDSGLIIQDEKNHHDPFDPMKLDPRDPSFSKTNPRGYALYPLIYSAGPDKSFDMEVGNTRSPVYDPYFPEIGKPIKDDGSPYDSDGKEENWYDNITNHELLAN